jgi:predicted aldo/keto reductase-like oxidoreductase
MSRRRDFLKAASVGTAAALSTWRQALLGDTLPETKAAGAGLRRRRLGRTGLEISEVSLGGSPLPEWPLFLELIERGVNYIDSSVSYDNGNCERQIGRMLKTLGRDKAFVGTKFHLNEDRWTEASIIKSAEGSLRRLQVETIDVLLIHGPEQPDQLTDDRVLGAFEKMRKSGIFRFNGFSCHANHAVMVRRAVECGKYDMVQLGYNVFDIDRPEDKVQAYEDYLGESGLRGLISQAVSAGLGIIAMKTLKIGGRRQNLAAFQAVSTSLQQAMLKWVLEDKNVTSAITEILNRGQMDEDLGAAGSALTAEERRMLFAHVAENTAEYCRGCSACRSNCPSRIRTTDMLRALAYEESYGKTGRGRDLFIESGGAAALAACRDCGMCERVCPYRIPVRRRLAAAAAVFMA